MRAFTLERGVLVCWPWAVANININGAGATGYRRIRSAAFGDVGVLVYGIAIAHCNTQMVLPESAPGLSASLSVGPGQCRSTSRLDLRLSLSSVDVGPNSVNVF